MLFAAVVAIATAVYAVLTWKLVSETRRMRKSQTDAKVVLGLDVRPEYFHFVDVVVRNEGVGPAYDVAIDVQMVGGGGDASILRTIQALGFVERGIAYFSPNQEIRSYLTSLLEDHETKMSTQLRAEVCYRTASGTPVTDEYLLDFSIFRGRTRLGEPDLYRIAKSLDALARDVHAVIDGSRKPTVLTQGVADYRQEMREYYERVRGGGNQEDPDRTAEEEAEV